MLLSEFSKVKKNDHPNYIYGKWILILGFNEYQKSTFFIFYK